MTFYESGVNEVAERKKLLAKISNGAADLNDRTNSMEKNGAINCGKSSNIILKKFFDEQLTFMVQTK